METFFGSTRELNWAFSVLNPEVFLEASLISIFKIKTNFVIGSAWDRVSYSVHILWTPELGFHGPTLGLRILTTFSMPWISISFAEILLKVVLFANHDHKALRLVFKDQWKYFLPNPNDPLNWFSLQNDNFIDCEVVWKCAVKR